MSRQCLACGRYPAATTAEWPALCQACLDRAGEPVQAGDRVICEVDDDCSGTVSRLEDDGLLAVVRTVDGKEAWLPIQNIVSIR